MCKMYHLTKKNTVHVSGMFQKILGKNYRCYLELTVRKANNVHLVIKENFVQLVSFTAETKSFYWLFFGRNDLTQSWQEQNMVNIYQRNLFGQDE